MSRVDDGPGPSPGDDHASRLRRDKIRAALTQALSPESLAIEDESHHHAGHAGAATGRGHFAVRIVSQAFAGVPPIQRHRLVYSALGEMMETDIHALSIKALTPEEAQRS